MKNASSFDELHRVCIRCSAGLIDNPSLLRSLLGKMEIYIFPQAVENRHGWILFVKRSWLRLVADRCITRSRRLVRKKILHENRRQIKDLVQEPIVPRTVVELRIQQSERF